MVAIYCSHKIDSGKLMNLFVIATGVAIAVALSGCSYTNRVEVELRTNSQAKLASARLAEPSNDAEFNRLALAAAKRRFPIRVPHPKPNHTYGQPVTITYPLIR